MPNRLVGQTSPYLLQHAQNPVDWYPWGPEALGRARDEDRPILLSVGYSACHWCHVMERESFEDPDTAALMNQAFVNIKVDREERPDIDGIYMKAVQAMTGQGGWPLTVFLTPDAVPYFGGTYFPPEPRHGMPSFPQVLEAARAAWSDRRGQVQEAGQRLRALLDRSTREALPVAGPTAFSPSTVDTAVESARRAYDPQWGGFGGAPKFPQPVLLDLLLRSGGAFGERDGSDMALHTLRQMARGGMRDQLGGGFHRYSVDARWLVPHFEKMLYDNALLARAYSDAALRAGDSALARVALETLDDMIDDLGDPDGPFYAARDADSEGEEGTYYVWTPDQVRAHLPADEARLFQRVFDVTESGNFEGKNVLHVPHDLDAVARSEGMVREDLDQLLEQSASLLKASRSEREAPGLDDKILAGWNGMMIRALAEVGTAHARPDLVKRSAQAAAFILDWMRADDILFRVFAGGTAAIPGFLEDYGGLGNGCLSLYEVTLDPTWLDASRWCAEALLEHFWDEEDGLFHDAARDGESLLVRPRDIMDNATPSGNSLAVELLARLAPLSSDGRFQGITDRVLEREAGMLQRYPTSAARLIVGGIRAHAPRLEVSVAGSGDVAQAMVRTAHGVFHANRIVSGGDPADPVVEKLPTMEGRLEAHPRAYICLGQHCLEPTSSAAALAEQLAGL